MFTSLVHPLIKLLNGNILVFHGKPLCIFPTTFQLKASLESFHFEIDVIIPKIGESICFRI